MQTTFVLFVLLCEIVRRSYAIEVPCDSAIICPNALAEFSCAVYAEPAILTWIVPQTDSLTMTMTLRHIADNPDRHNITMDIYKALIIESNSSYIASKLTFIAPMKLTNNNKEIICARGSGSNENDRMYCPFIIESKPSSPLNLTVFAINSTAVNISWLLPANGSCIDYYSVRVENGSMIRNLTTDSTSIIVIVDELGRGINYAFSVRAVDLGGTEGIISERVALTMDVPDRVIDLNASIFSDNLNVTWDVPDSTKPPVLGYIIHHNITMPEVNMTNYTFILFMNVPCGTHYIDVRAKNVIGVGESVSTVTVKAECKESSVTSMAITTLSVASSVEQSMSHFRTEISSVTGSLNLSSQTAGANVFSTKTSLIKYSTFLFSESSYASPILPETKSPNQIPLLAGSSGAAFFIVFLCLLATLLSLLFIIKKRKIKVSRSKVDLCGDQVSPCDGKSSAIEMNNHDAENPPPVPAYNPSSFESQLSNGDRSSKLYSFVGEHLNQHKHIQVASSSQGGEYSVLQRETRQPQIIPSPASSDYSQINLKDKEERSSRQTRMHAKQKSSDGEYSALQGETRLPQIPLPASSDYLQINLKDMEERPLQQSTSHQSTGTTIMYAELEQFSDIKNRPAAPLKLSSVVYSTVGKITAPPIPAKLSRTADISGNSTASDVPPPIPKKLSGNKDDVRKR